MMTAQHLRSLLSSWHLFEGMYFSTATCHFGPNLVKHKFYPVADIILIFFVLFTAVSSDDSPVGFMRNKYKKIN